MKKVDVLRSAQVSDLRLRGKFWSDGRHGEAYRDFNAQFCYIAHLAQNLERPQAAVVSIPESAGKSR